MGSPPTLMFFAAAAALSAASAQTTLWNGGAADAERTRSGVVPGPQPLPNGPLRTMYDLGNAFADQTTMGEPLLVAGALLATVYQLPTPTDFPQPSTVRINPATGAVVFNVIHTGLVPAFGNAIYAYPAPSAVGDAFNTTGRGVVVVSGYGVSAVSGFCSAAGQCKSMLWGASGVNGSLQWTRNLTGQGWLVRDVVADAATPAVYALMSNGTVLCVDSTTGVELGRATLFTSTGLPFPSRVFDGPFFLALTNNGTDAPIVVASNGTGLVGWLPSRSGGVGEILWSTAKTAPSAKLTDYGRPAVHASLRRVVVANASSLVAFDLFTGALLWTTPYPGVSRSLPTTSDLGLSRNSSVAFVSTRRHGTGACIMSFNVSSGALLGQICLDPNVLQWGRGFALDSDPAEGGAAARLYMQLYDFRDAVQSAMLTTFSVSNPASITVRSVTPVPDSSASSLAYIAVGPSGRVFQMARGPSSYAESRSLREVVAALPALSALNSRLAQTNLWASLLNGTANYTVFSPNNTAIVSLNANAADFFFNAFNVDALAQLLGCHVVPGRVLSSSLSNGQTLPTANGVALSVTIAAGVVTLSAPGGATAARVVAADYQAPDGIVHVLDSVLVAPDGPTGYPSADLVSVAGASSELTTLVASLALTGLARSLSAPAGPFVVFAPSNAAFASINATNASVATLLEHVVAGPRLYTSQIVNGFSVRTLANTTLTFVVGVGGSITVNGRALISSNVDVQASNGVLHFLAGVITPTPSPTPAPLSPTPKPNAATPAAATAGVAAFAALAAVWTLAGAQ